MMQVMLSKLQQLSIYCLYLAVLASHAVISLQRMRCYMCVFVEILCGYSGAVVFAVYESLAMQNSVQHCFLRLACQPTLFTHATVTIEPDVMASVIMANATTTGGVLLASAAVQCAALAFEMLYLTDELLYYALKHEGFVGDFALKLANLMYSVALKHQVCSSS
jgi:hypothetical protein